MERGGGKKKDKWDHFHLSLFHRDFHSGYMNMLVTRRESFLANAFNREYEVQQTREGHFAEMKACERLRRSLASD